MEIEIFGKSKQASEEIQKIVTEMNLGLSSMNQAVKNFNSDAKLFEKGLITQKQFDESYGRLQKIIGLRKEYTQRSKEDPDIIEKTSSVMRHQVRLKQELVEKERALGSQIKFNRDSYRTATGDIDYEKIEKKNKEAEKELKIAERLAKIGNLHAAIGDPARAPVYIDMANKHTEKAIRIMDTYDKGRVEANLSREEELSREAILLKKGFESAKNLTADYYRTLHAGEQAVQEDIIKTQRTHEQAIQKRETLEKQQAIKMRPFDQRVDSYSSITDIGDEMHVRYNMNKANTVASRAELQADLDKIRSKMKAVGESSEDYAKLEMAMRGVHAQIIKHNAALGETDDFLRNKRYTAAVHDYADKSRKMTSEQSGGFTGLNVTDTIDMMEKEYKRAEIQRDIARTMSEINSSSDPAKVNLYREALRGMVKDANQLDIELGRTEKGGRRFRHAMTQALYGASDFTTILTMPGMGLKDALRASANNFEMLAFSIGEKAFLFTSLGTMAAQAGLAIWDYYKKTAAAGEGNDSYSETLNKSRSITEQYRLSIESLNEERKKEIDLIKEARIEEGAKEAASVDKELRKIKSSEDPSKAWIGDGVGSAIYGGLGGDLYEFAKNEKYLAGLELKLEKGEINHEQFNKGLLDYRSLGSVEGVKGPVLEKFRKMERERYKREAASGKKEVYTPESLPDHKRMGAETLVRMVQTRTLNEHEGLSGLTFPFKSYGVNLLEHSNKVMELEKRKEEIRTASVESLAAEKKKKEMEEAKKKEEKTIEKKKKAGEAEFKAMYERSAAVLYADPEKIKGIKEGDPRAKKYRIPAGHAENISDYKQKADQELFGTNVRDTSIFRAVKEDAEEEIVNESKAERRRLELEKERKELEYRKSGGKFTAREKKDLSREFDPKFSALEVKEKTAKLALEEYLETIEQKLKQRQRVLRGAAGAAPGG